MTDLERFEIVDTGEEVILYEDGVPSVIMSYTFYAQLLNHPLVKEVYNNLT